MGSLGSTDAKQEAGAEANGGKASGLTENSVYDISKAAHPKCVIAHLLFKSIGMF